MIPLLSSRDQDRLRQALEKIADDEAAEDTPDTVIAKVAEELGVPGGHLNILVRAYNTARSALQRDSGDTSREKAAEFHLATTGGVMGLLYPEKLAAPREQERRAGISPEYAKPPDWYMTPQDDHADLLSRMSEKAAELSPPIRSASKEDFQRAYKRAMAIGQRLEHGRLKVAQAEQRTIVSLERIITTLKSAGAPAWIDVRRNATIKYGQAGAAVMEQVIRMDTALRRRDDGDPYHKVSQYAALYEDIAETIKRAQELIATDTAYCEEVRRGQDKIAEELKPFLDDDAEEDSEDEEDELLGGKLKLAGPGDNPAPAPRKGPGVMKQVLIASAVTKMRDMLDGLGKNYPKPDPGAAIESAMGKLRDPLHDSQIQDIETKYMIQDMMLNDPVISGHDPQTIGAALGEISRTAPHLSRQPLLIRPLLRRALEMGNLDAFEGADAVNTESKLRDMNRPSPSALGAKPNVPAARPGLG